MKMITCLLGVGAMLFASVLPADPFTPEDVQKWDAEFQSVVAAGRKSFTDPTLGSNGVVCAQCHPNGANTHPETYPKFQKQLGKVSQMWEMVNWCIRNPLEGQSLAADDPRMTALISYITYERRNVPLDPGKH